MATRSTPTSGSDEVRFSSEREERSRLDSRSSSLHPESRASRREASTASASKASVRKLSRSLPRYGRSQHRKQGSAQKNVLATDLPRSDAPVRVLRQSRSAEALSKMVLHVGDESHKGARSSPSDESPERSVRKYKSGALRSTFRKMFSRPSDELPVDSLPSAQLPATTAAMPLNGSSEQVAFQRQKMYKMQSEGNLLARPVLMDVTPVQPMSDATGPVYAQTLPDLDPVSQSRAARSQFGDGPRILDVCIPSAADADQDNREDTQQESRGAGSPTKPRKTHHSRTSSHTRTDSAETARRVSVKRFQAVAASTASNAPSVVNIRTAPRQTMEMTSLLARVAELESRMTVVERTQRRLTRSSFPSEPIIDAGSDRMTNLPSANARVYGRSNTPTTFHTPPAFLSASPNPSHDPRRPWLRKDSSESSVDFSPPRTPSLSMAETTEAVRMRNDSPRGVSSGLRPPQYSEQASSMLGTALNDTQDAAAQSRFDQHADGVVYSQPGVRMSYFLSTLASEKSAREALEADILTLRQQLDQIRGSLSPQPTLLPGAVTSEPVTVPQAQRPFPDPYSYSQPRVPVSHVQPLHDSTVLFPSGLEESSNPTQPVQEIMPRPNLENSPFSTTAVSTQVHPFDDTYTRLAAPDSAPAYLSTFAESLSRPRPLRHAVGTISAQREAFGTDLPGTGMYSPYKDTWENYDLRRAKTVQPYHRERHSDQEYTLRKQTPSPQQQQLRNIPALSSPGSRFSISSVYDSGDSDGGNDSAGTLSDVTSDRRSPVRFAKASTVSNAPVQRVLGHIVDNRQARLATDFPTRSHDDPQDKIDRTSDDVFAAPRTVKPGKSNYLPRRSVSPSTPFTKVTLGTQSLARTGLPVSQHHRSASDPARSAITVPSKRYQTPLATKATQLAAAPKHPLSSRSQSLRTPTSSSSLIPRTSSTSSSTKDHTTSRSQPSLLAPGWSHSASTKGKAKSGVDYSSSSTASTTPAPPAKAKRRDDSARTEGSRRLVQSTRAALAAGNEVQSDREVGVGF